jgi:ATP-binding cassette subfamily B protein
MFFSLYSETPTKESLQKEIEQLLQEIIDQLPAKTTKIIIAHRLNTIADADEIFFVNAGEVTQAGSMKHAVDMLLRGKRES